VQVHDGKFTVVGDTEKPFNCWDNSSSDWSEPESTSFD
jgi:hypothetical protein